MYRDSFSEPRWMRLLRWLSASFRLGRFFGVEVRVFYLALVVTPLILLRPMEGLPFAQAALWIALVTVGLYVVIWTHEMGHIAAGRRYGMVTPLITLSPLGGLAHMSTAMPSPRKEIAVALAGPAVHLLWLVVFVPLALIFESGDLAPADWRFDPLVSFIETMVWINVALTVFNLLPFFPLDGGRVLRGYLAGRMHPNRATLKATRVGTIGGWIFIVVGIYLWVTPPEDLWGIILVLIGISALMACKQERMAAQHAAGPYMENTPRQPWEMDADAWKQGAQPGEPSRRELRRAEREARRQAEAEEARRKLDAEVDRVLDRLNEVGMAGLSAKERKILEQAAKRRREP